MKLNQLPDHSRVWIYQADRKLSDQEVQQIEEQGKLFISNWAAHGSDLKASFEVLYHYFVVVAVDENHAGATGCSIDKSVHFMQQLGDTLQVDFFNRLNAAYVAENNQIELVSMKEFEELLESGELNSTTIVFDNTVQSLEAIRKNWKVAVKDSWHGRLLPH